MAIYYIRKTGNDANAGTSPGAAWATFTKALGAAGVASGDTVWAGAGVYREVITVNMTSAVAETKVYGDVDGSNTGDAGEVQLTGYTTNDTTAPSATTLLNLNGRDFLSFQDIVFVGGAAPSVTATTNTSTDIKWTRCCFMSGSLGNQVTFNITSAANVALNWVIDSCMFYQIATTPFLFSPAKPATADFNLNVVIKNCMFIGGQLSSIRLNAPSGANTFKPGGIDIRNCTNIGNPGFIQALSTDWSTTIPITVYNCLLFGNSNLTLMIAGAAGQIIEDYNVLVSSGTLRTNITAGAHTIGDGSYAPVFYTGHEYYSVGSNLKPFGMPKPGSPLLGFGNQAGSPTTDILGVTRPATPGVGAYELSTPFVFLRHILDLKRSGRRLRLNDFVKRKPL